MSLAHTTRINQRYGAFARALGLLAAAATITFSSGVEAAAATLPPAPQACTTAAPACFTTFTPPGAAGTLTYYTSLPTPSPSTPTAALIALHGHPRDANKTFNAAISAARSAGRLADTLIIAPLFQVAAENASRCETPGAPAAQPGNIVWTCSSWMAGGAGKVASAPSITSFAALDALIDDLHQRYPTIKTITVFGFSAGAQTIQHYIGFANPSAASTVRLRFVVSDPGTWLYFDAFRPYPPTDPASCPTMNAWKYGVDKLPANLGRTAVQARAHYAQAEVHYMEGALDTSDGRAAYYKILDKSCAAQAQGPYRLERGLAYAAYDRKLIAPQKNREVTVVPDCGHKVECVLPSPAARPVVFP